MYMHTYIYMYLHMHLRSEPYSCSDLKERLFVLHNLTHLWCRIWLKLPPPPPGGVCLLGGFQFKSPEEEDPPWKTTPRIDQFRIFFSGGDLPPVSSSCGLFIWKPPKKKTPEGGACFHQSDCTLEDTPRWICALFSTANWDTIWALTPRNYS